MDDLANAISAAIGGVVSTFVLYPIEIVKNNLQTSTGDATFIETAQTISKTSGLSGFYAGIRGSCSSAALEKIIYYYIYSFLSRRIGASSGASFLAVGYISDFVHLPMTMVFEKIMISQQVAAKKGVSIQFMDEFYRIQKDEGWPSFYQGWRAYFVLAFKPAIENAVFDQIRSYLIKARQNKILSGMEAFLLGALARAVATICAYPAYRALRMSQKKKKKKKNLKEDNDVGVNGGGLLQELKVVLRTNGISGLYQGIVPDITRGVLSSALRSSIKERLYMTVNGMLL